MKARKIFLLSGLSLLPLMSLQTGAIAATEAQQGGAAPSAAAGGERGKAVQMPIQAGSEPVLFTADELVHDQQLGIVTARGHVEIAQGESVMTADQVSYNLKQDLVTATGNVVLVDADGNVSFADYFELTGDMKEGTAQNIRVRLSDRSRIAAVSAVRSKGQVNSMAKGVYSPCELCKDDPDRPPLWQLKAEKVTHDEIEHEIVHENVTLEMAGLPVFYTPYLSHPDPTVKRKSGFLSPRIGVGENLGTGLTTPYFWAITPEHDVTIEPTYTSLEGPLLAVEQRSHFKNGAMRNYGSITQDSGGNVRGHIEADGRFDLNETWRTGYTLQRASGRTYTRRYGYSFSEPYLSTRPYLEGFQGRSYAQLEALSYQSLVEGVNDSENPVVLPFAEARIVTDPGRHNGFWSIDTSAVALTRSEGPDTRRISARPFWNLPYTSPAGDQYEFRAGFRGDVYNVNEPSGSGSGIKNYGRFQPETSLNWRYPFVKAGDKFTQVVQPLAMIAVSPRGGNLDTLPNEDSRGLEFDDTNLFRPNRFAGYDRVEGGPRGAYGLHWMLQGRGYQSAEVLFGQAWHMNEDSVYPVGSGLEERFSDYVGHVTLRPAGNFSLSDTFRVDKETYDVRYNQASMAVGPRALKASVSYIKIAPRQPKQPGQASLFARREQIGYGLTSEISRYWRVYASTTDDLVDNLGPLVSSFQLVYEDECLVTALDATIDHTTDKDEGSGNTLMLRFIFKNLGEFPVGLSGLGL